MEGLFHRLLSATWRACGPRDYRNRQAEFRPRPSASPLIRICAFLMCTLLSSAVNAHVKWFADWSIICPPRDPMRVLSAPLWQTFFASCVLTMMALAWLDWHLMNADGGSRFAVARSRGAAPSVALLILRIGVAAYWLMAAFTLPHSVYLTPELSAPGWISWVQAALAGLVIPRATAWLAGLGMIALYVLAIADYGWFHLLDYPLFLGIGVILLLTGRASQKYDLLGLLILRWSAAITIFWGGIEKFAYPEWSFPLLKNMRFLCLGVMPEAAMYMYGFGEIALAYGLLLFGMGSRISALLLLVIFLSAIAPFGWIDLVGHSGVCVALLVLFLTPPRYPLVLRKPAFNIVTHGVLFSAFTAIFLAAYFGLHQLYMHV